MAAIARILARKFPTTRTEVEMLKQLALLCCAGLFVSLLMMTYGLDISLGFFWRTVQYNAAQAEYDR
jgi:ribose/xylose/arabinose/galactoside ABC-type transport system permease subunit